MSMGNRPSFSREPKLQWAGSRERNLASVRGRTFFLTSLFIEPYAEETYEHGQSAKLLQRTETSVGWISRKKSRLRSRQNFFLDIPFYRTH